MMDIILLKFVTLKFGWRLIFIELKFIVTRLLTFRPVVGMLIVRARTKKQLL